MLQQAIQAFQSGNLSGSEVILKRVLAAYPKSLPALHILGLIKASQSKHVEAAELLKKAIKLNPTDASLHYNLAKALQESELDKESIPHHKKNLELAPSNPEAWLNYGKSLCKLHLDCEALDIFAKALQVNPKYTEAFLNIGATLIKLKRYEEAINAYEQAITLKPDYPEAWLKRGAAFSELNHHNEALGSYNKAIELKPDYHEAWSNRSTCLKELNYHDEALASYDTTVSKWPDDHETWTYRGALLRELKNYDESLASLQKAIAINSDYAPAWLCMGITFSELKSHDDALASYNKAIELKPDYHEAWSNRGLALKELKRYDEALGSYDKAIELKPEYYAAWLNKGVTFNDLRRYDDALGSYDMAISLKSDYHDAHWNKALTQLVIGNFKDGWQNYEYRWLRSNHEQMRHQHLPTLKNLDAISGKRVLVWSEQGFGDTIQFSRFLNTLSTLNAEIIFEVQEPIKTLLENSLDGCKVIGCGEAFSDVDFQIPLLSLPLLLNIDLDANISSTSYLKVSEESLAKWIQKLSLRSEKINIGIACSGNQEHYNDGNRSIALRFFEPLTKYANIFLIQKELRDPDQAFLSMHPEIRNLGNEIESFDDSASIVQAMDLIITVDTSLAHLSGALGKPTFVLLPWNPEWRWLLNRQDSPWYPTVKIFRQPAVGNWHAVMEEVIFQISPRPIE